MLVSRLICAVAGAAALFGAAPASAQFYFKGPDISGPRVTGEERALQDRLRRLHRGDAPPQVRHFLGDIPGTQETT